MFATTRHEALSKVYASSTCSAIIKSPTYNNVALALPFFILSQTIAITMRLSANTTANQISGFGIDGNRCLKRNHAGHNNKIVARSINGLWIEGTRLFKIPATTRAIKIKPEVIVPTIDEIAVCPKPRFKSFSTWYNPTGKSVSVIPRAMNAPTKPKIRWCFTLLF